MPAPALAGNAVVITGAGRGLGRAYALHAAASGACVVVNDIDRDAADAVAAEIGQRGGTAATHVGSVAEPDAARSLTGLCLSRFGRLDGLVNNAGLRHESPPWSDDPRLMRAAVEVNLLGALYCGTEALAVMRQQRGGSVVNVSSRAQSGIHNSAAYAATKGALASLTYSWAVDMRPFGVTVNAIAPQARGTGTRRKLEPVAADDPLPDQIAPLVTFLLSRSAAGITGQVIRIGGRRDALSIGLMTHPRSGVLLQSPAGWDVPALEHAFSAILSTQLEPVGAAPVPVAYATAGGRRVTVWHSDSL
jgi:NAD(P)-dependent dehydrogenase (short-subunit alcohol dehydrogenase family)